MATTTQTPIPNTATLRVGHSPMKPRKKAVWEWTIVRTAIKDALLKLNPRKMMGNPVMFVVEIGCVITTGLLFKGGAAFKFNLQITLWLWFTVLFANFAEAMAEGRGKAQADSLRKTKTSASAKKLAANGKVEIVAAASLRKGDICLCEPNDVIPGDGDVIVQQRRQLVPAIVFVVRLDRVPDVDLVL